MTPVIVATHADGVVRVYQRHADGAVTQTARFVADLIEPPALAELVAGLSDSLHWNGQPTKPVAAPPPAAIPIGRGKTVKGDFRKRSRAGRAETEQRRALVLTHLTKGEATAMEIGAAVFPHLPDPTGKARKVLDSLTVDGLVARVPASSPTRFRKT